MTTVEPRAGLRGRREVHAVTTAGYARNGTPRTGTPRTGTARRVDDVRRGGPDALAATSGANAYVLAPTPPRRGAAPMTRGGAASRSPARSERSERSVGLQAGTKGATAAPAEAGARIAVAPPAPVNTPRAPFVTLVLAVVIVGVLGILVINTKINENAFHVHDLRAQQANLDRREQQLLQEIAQRESPGSLAAAARRLGLVRADTPAYLRLPDGRQLGMPRPAAGPPSVTGGQAAGAAPAPGG